MRIAIVSMDRALAAVREHRARGERIPAVVVPFTMDQPFWGARVAALGVGPTPIPRARLTENGLATALRITVSDQAMRARAAELGERIRAEDGVGEAVVRFGELADARAA